MKTRLYDKIPGSIVGPDKFEGFLDVPIESRQKFVESVVESIKISRTSAETSTAFPIIGEWGQGKTDSYYRFIRPYINSKDDYSFIVSTSTLARTYKNEELLRITGKTNLVAVHFLANVFEAIRSEARSESESGVEESEKIPMMEDFSDPVSYLEIILEKLTENNTKKIFIFIDEFEEILNHEETILRDVISGMKETINSTFNGTLKDSYKNAIHFFVAITPDALYKLKTLEGIEEIFGGLQQRFDPITLQGLNRKESIFYLKKLLDDCYNNNLPDPYPIESIGLFNTLSKISQKNIRNLRKLFISLFSSLELDGELEVLNYQILLEFLKTKKISVYGAETNCIEIHNYDRIIENLEEQPREEEGILASNLFKLFIANYSPMDINFLSNRLNVDSNSILKTITLINDHIRDKDTIERAIIKLSPLKSEYRFEDIRNVLQDDIEFNEIFEKDELVFGLKIPYREFIDEFRDRITFQELNESKELCSRIYLPTDEIDIRMFFKDEILPEVAYEIKMKFQNLIDDKITYTPNELVLNNIYPTPIPPELNCIKDKEKRFDIYRNVLKNLNELYVENIKDAFISTLINSKIYGIDDKKIENIDTYKIVEFTDAASKTPIKFLLYSVNGDVKSDDIEYIDSILSGDRSIHLAIILYNSSISKKALDLMENQDIIGIHIHPKVSKTLLSIYQGLEICENKIDYTILQSVSEKIIQKDFSFDDNLTSWLEIGLKKGLVIEQIETSAKTFKQLADCLKLYINYEDTPHTPNSIFEINKSDLLGFKKYKKNMIGLIGSDFESSKSIEELSIDLASNGFLEKKGSTYLVTKHPVEKKLELMFENEGKIYLNDLKNSFIIREKNKNVISDIFLEILVYRGKIQKGKKRKGEQENFVLVNTDSELTKLKKSYNTFEEFVNKDNNKLTGHIYVSKQRDDNLILVEDYYKRVNNLFESIKTLESAGNPSEFAKKIYLTDKLIDYFAKTYQKDISDAHKTEKQWYDQVKNKMIDFNKDFDEVLELSEEFLNIKFPESNLNIQDYRRLKKYFDEFIEFYENKSDKTDLLNLKESLSEDEIPKFKFDLKPANAAYYFNLRLFEFEKYMNRFNEAANAIEKQLERNKQNLERIQEEIADLKKDFDTINTSEEYRISYMLAKQITFSDLDSDEEHQIIEDIKLSELEKRSKDKIDSVKENIRKTSRNINIVDSTLKEEVHLISKMKEYENNIDLLKANFDVKPLKDDIKNFIDHLSRIKNQYNDISLAKIEKGDAEGDASFFVKKLRKAMEKQYSDNIIDTWKEFVIDINEKATKMKNDIDTVIKIEEKAGKDFDKKDKSQIDKIIKNINILKKVPFNPLESENSAHNIKNTFFESQNSWRAILIKILDDKEQELLDIINELSTKSKWIDYVDLCDRALESGIDQNTLEGACNGLVEKKYLRKGFCRF